MMIKLILENLGRLLPGLSWIAFGRLGEWIMRYALKGGLGIVVGCERLDERENRGTRKMNEGVWGLTFIG
jgi:hypothetical protein